MEAIGFVFQSFNLIDELNVFENVELPLTYLGIKASERKPAGLPGQRDRDSHHHHGLPLHRASHTGRLRVVHMSETVNSRRTTSRFQSKKRPLWGRFYFSCPTQTGHSIYAAALQVVAQESAP